MESTLFYGNVEYALECQRIGATAHPTGVIFSHHPTDENLL